MKSLVLICFLAIASFAKADSQATVSRPHISADIAKKLLIRKAPIICPHVVMPARVTGTVVLGILIGKSGDVQVKNVISGPAMLRQPVVDAIRKYKYKPYLLEGKVAEVETTVSVTMDSYLDCPVN